MIVTSFDAFASARRPPSVRDEFREKSEDDDRVVVLRKKEPETPRKRPLTAPRPRKPIVHVELRQQRAFEQYSRLQGIERRKKMEIVNRYEEQVAAFDAKKFRERFSPQRMVRFSARKRDKGLIESIARQRNRKATPIFCD